MKQLNLTKYFKFRQGFTMVEIVVASSIVAMVLVAITSGVTFAVRNSRYSQEKSLSVRYAQEGVEWLRSQRDILGWAAFTQTLTSISASNTFELCVPTITLETRLTQGMLHGSNCAQIDSKFVRVIEVERVSSDHIQISSQVTWGSGGDTYETTLMTSLFEWR